MKITERLAGDHETFRKIMAELDAISAYPADESVRRRLIRLVELFVDHLLIHAWGEENFYYPAVRRSAATTPDSVMTADFMDRLNREHEEIDRRLVQLENEVKARPIAAGWPQTYRLFSRDLIAHMRAEEEELFPASEARLGEKALEKLSLELEKHRSEAPKARPHSRL